MTRPPRARLASAARRALVALLVVGLLTGCSGAAPDLTDAAAARLQQDVLEVTRAAAADDLPAARTALDALTAQVTSDRGAGTLSAARQAQIEAAIAGVLAEVTALEVAAQAQATATATAHAAAAKAQAQAAAAAAAKDRRNERGKDKKNGG